MSVLREPITVVALDLGGVVANDIWEHAFLDPSHGIAATYGIAPAVAEDAALRLWREFSCSPPPRGWRQQECDYWQRCIDVLELPAEVDALIDLTDRFIVPLPGMLDLIDRLNARTRVVLCSNNTEFWYQREAVRFGLGHRFTEAEVFLSCRIGSEKGSPDQAVFRTLVHRLGARPEQVLLVDDRAKNIQAATNFGMSALLFPAHASWGSVYLEPLLRRWFVP